MARYRKVDPRIWNDAKFRALNDQGKLSFMRETQGEEFAQQVHDKVKAAGGVKKK